MHTRRLSLPALLLALLGALASVVVHVPTAQASSTILCKGFTACTKAGYSNFGYSAVYTKMWWRMYAGHNCTNYMSYRMVSRGMSATRPWSGSGDARNWGVVFKSKVTQTPSIGSIAWWSSNHVAYVQQIIDANTIVISEDHYRGDFDWRRIVRSGGGWPTGFIHLNDEAVTATAAPAITAGLTDGAPQVGVPMTVSTGGWTGAPTIAVQWLADGVAIAGATAMTYTPAPADLGRTLSARITASQAGYLPGTATTAAPKVTIPGVIAPVAAPTITGIPKVGAVLTATPASFSPAPAAVTTTWLADGVAIPGATGPTLLLGANQLGRTITAVATASKAGYRTATRASAPTAKVGPENLTVQQEPTLTGGLFAGDRLAVNPGVIEPSGVTTTYTWLRNGVVVPPRVARTYLLTEYDVRTRLAVRVTYTKPGYVPVVRTLTTARTVQAHPGVGVASRSPKSITVLVKAVGIPAVQGKVVVSLPSGKRRTLTLHGGKATFSAPWLYRGLREVTVSYLGSYAVPAVQVTRQVTIR